MSDEIKQNPEGKSHKELRKEYTFNKLKGLGQEIIEEIEKQKVPSVKVPSRGTSNIVYDESEEETLFEEKTVASGNLDSRIAILTVDGTIQDTGDSASLLSSETYNHQAFLEQLQQVKDDETVKGIILKVNSPGGGVIESKQIYEAIKAIQKDRKIPVYSSMGSMAASGGYYISAPADKIFADEETMTGSIGVIMHGAC